MNNTTNNKPVIKKFETNDQQLLDLVINSLYSNKEIFLRELISNASDAIEKLRYESIEHPHWIGQGNKFAIKVAFSKKNKLIKIEDNGIGMTFDDVVQNLGTIAKSGTQEFLKELQKNKGKAISDMKCIGQFGVGFYSSFLVADKVTVETRKAGVANSKGVRFVSSAQNGTYSLEEIEKNEYGLTVILHVKNDDEDFLSEYRLREIINKYSNHILFPIYLVDADADDDKSNKGETDDIAKDKAINDTTAIWTMPKKNISEEEYKNFYTHLSHDPSAPLFWLHKFVEGKNEYIFLVYIPSHAPFDLWNQGKMFSKKGLKLYVQRVFIMEDSDQFIPNYLRFVKGIIDAKDLPLNVSREILQNNKIIEKIKAGITTQIISELERIARDEKETYIKFWKEFGQILKEGVAEDFSNKDKLLKLLRFSSSFRDEKIDDKDDKMTSDVLTSLDEYKLRMLSGQNAIYYITAESLQAANNNPNLEIFHHNKIEVIFFVDRIDEWILSSISEYGGTPLVSVTSGGLDVDELLKNCKLKDSIENEDSTNESEASSKHKDKKSHAEGTKIDPEKHELLQKLTKRMQEVLQDKTEEIRISSRLIDSPACIVTKGNVLSAGLRKAMQSMGQYIPEEKCILEINPDHILISNLISKMDSAEFVDWCRMLFDQALLTSGGQLDNPAEFVKRLNRLLAN